MIISWTEAAWEDFVYWQEYDRKTLKRILKLIKDIERNGYNGIGKPERLSNVARIIAINSIIYL